MALSKSYTAKVIGDVVRNIASEYGNNKLQPRDILDYVNLAVLKVYNDIPKFLYQFPVTVTVSGGFIDLSSLIVEAIIKITDTANNKWIPAGPDEIENFTDNIRRQNNVYYSHEGQRVKVYKGDNTSDYGTITMLYEREITLCSSEDDYIDVPDKYAPAVMEIAKAITHEKLRISLAKETK